MFVRTCGNIALGAFAGVRVFLILPPKGVYSIARADRCLPEEKARGQEGTHLSSSNEKSEVWRPRLKFCAWEGWRGGWGEGVGSVPLGYEERAMKFKPFPHFFC